MMEIGIGLIRLQEWFNGDFKKVVELVRIADEAGIDVVSMTDHLGYTPGVVNYPFGAFNFSPDTPCYEPIVGLSAIAAVTQRIKLSTGVLLAPLRPALLLAKQLATLDVLSGGRVQIGVGAGWQKEEFDAMRIPFDGRFGNLMEQVDAMRALWSGAPADYHGRSVDFTSMHSLPFPIQGGNLPVLFGVSGSERNLERIARHGDGWIPIERDPAKLKPMIDRLKEAFLKAGRNPDKLIVRVMPEGTSSTAQQKIAASGPLDLRILADRIPAYLDAGVTQLELHPTVWIDRPEQFAELMAQFAALKG